MSVDDNPFELAPELQPGLYTAADIVRAVFDTMGLDLTELVISFEVRDERFGDRPMRTAVSWPQGKPDMGAGLAAEGAEVLKRASIAKRARGSG